MEKVNYQSGDEVKVIKRLHGHTFLMGERLKLIYKTVWESGQKSWVADSLDRNHVRGNVYIDEIKPYEPKKGKKKVAIMQGAVLYDPDIMQKTSDKIEEENLITQRGFGSKWCIKLTAENVEFVKKWLISKKDMAVLRSRVYIHSEVVFSGGCHTYYALSDWYKKHPEYTEITTEQFLEHIFVEEITPDVIDGYSNNTIAKLRRDLEQSELKLKKFEQFSAESTAFFTKKINLLNAQNESLTKRFAAKPKSFLRRNIGYIMATLLTWSAFIAFILYIEL